MPSGITYLADPACGSEALALVQGNLPKEVDRENILITNLAQT
jgi:hypothetical protein